jgi:hypothetical protein
MVLSYCDPVSTMPWPAYRQWLLKVLARVQPKVEAGKTSQDKKGVVMAGKNTAVYGIYPTQSAVEMAVDTLKAEGFRSTDISVLMPENIGTKDFAHAKATKAPEGAAAGAGTGAVVGGALGWLVGIGSLAIPGVGPFIAAGPIVASLAGVGVGGALGGIAGGLVGMGIPEYEAKRYEGRIRKGGILLSVHSDNSEWTKRAKRTLERTGAEDISSSGEASADFAKSDKPRPRTTRVEEEFPEEAVYAGVERRTLNRREAGYTGVERRHSY